MNEKIQAYLDKKAAELRKDEEERRRELLIDEGLCERVYAPEGGQYSEEAYPEWDSDKGRAYRIETYAVTDEEFREIEKVAGKQAGSKEYGARLTGLANVVSWVGIVASIITGFIFMGIDEDLMLIGLIIAAVGALVFWISSWFLHAFGQLVTDTHAIRKAVEREDA